MVCWMAFLDVVMRWTGVSEKEAEEILRDIENEVGHNKELIKAIVDAEKEDLVKRLRKKKKKRTGEREIAYV